MLNCAYCTLSQDGSDANVSKLHNQVLKANKVKRALVDYEFEELD